jgi:hypothetical protein
MNVEQQDRTLGTAVSDATLDAILTIQLKVAWAGEGRGSPPRLGWWQTDLIDEAGGGDFMARLLPRTHAWASLEAVREAARRTDAKARTRMGDPDKLRTLFFLGFAADEALGDRLSILKREGRSPVEALPLGLVQQKFSHEALVSEFEHKDVSFTVAPGGRQLKGPMPTDLRELVEKLAAGLVRLDDEHPRLADEYPLPFYKVGA